MSTKVPSVIIVPPLTYTLVKDKAAINAAQVASKTALFGETDHEALTITLAPDIAVEKERVVVLHETLHGCNSVAGIIEDLGVDDEERFVLRLAPVLLNVLRSNSALVAYLTA